MIDVGYAGVIGADRIEHGRAPYGNFPIEGNLPPCGRPDANGNIHERIQPDGRCETANPFGDTYGPVTRMRHTFRAYGFSAGPGGGITCPPSATRRSRSTCWRCWGLPPSDSGSGGRYSRRRSPSPGRLTIHSVRRQRPHQRHVHAGATRVGILRAHVRSTPRSPFRTRRLGQVCRAHRRAAVGVVPHAPPASARPLVLARLSSGDRRVRLDHPPRRKPGARALTSSSSGRSRSRSTVARPSRSGTGASTTLRACRICTSCRNRFRRCWSSAPSPSSWSPGGSRRSNSPLSRRCS